MPSAKMALDCRKFIKLEYSLSWIKVLINLAALQKLFQKSCISIKKRDQL